MTEIGKILSDTNHRPYGYPSGKWNYYQEWNHALFLHWIIPFDILRPLVPQKLNLDSFKEDFYVSLVAFTMQKIRPRNLPSIKLISNFEEINIRTYINNDNKKGVYFLNIEAQKRLSAFIAKTLSGLPYEKSNIKRQNNQFRSNNFFKNYHLDTEFKVTELLENKSALDKWLTERYCLYMNKKYHIYRHDIHHKEWKIKQVEITRLDLSYKIGDIDLTNKSPDLIHYSDGVKVVAWKRTKI